MSCTSAPVLLITDRSAALAGYHTRKSKRRRITSANEASTSTPDRLAPSYLLRKECTELQVALYADPASRLRMCAATLPPQAAPSGMTFLRRAFQACGPDQGPAVALRSALTGTHACARAHRCARRGGEGGELDRL